MTEPPNAPPELHLSTEDLADLRAFGRLWSEYDGTWAFSGQQKDWDDAVERAYPTFKAVFEACLPAECLPPRDVLNQKTSESPTRRMYLFAFHHDLGNQSLSELRASHGEHPRLAFTFGNPGFGSDTEQQHAVRTAYLHWVITCATQDRRKAAGYPAAADVADHLNSRLGHLLGERRFASAALSGRKTVSITFAILTASDLANASEADLHRLIRAGRQGFAQVLALLRDPAHAERLRQTLEETGMAPDSTPTERAQSPASERPPGAHPLISRPTRALALARNLVLEGVPGTGKTHAIHRIRAEWNQLAAGDENGIYEIRHKPFIRTMHPATTYEDFIGGLQPTPDGSFAYTRGFFLEACDYAQSKPDEDVLVVLDEFNRCNVPKVMGDLLTVLEPSKRATRDKDKRGFTGGTSVKLPGGARAADSNITQRDSDDQAGKLTVPENILVLATMNTTDRSVAPLDAALRRRFAFHRLWPLGFDPAERREADHTASLIWATATRSPEHTPPTYENVSQSPEGVPARFVASVRAWHGLNTHLMTLGSDAFLGHSYLYAMAADLASYPERDHDFVVRHHWNHQLLPALGETLVAHRRARRVDLEPMLATLSNHGVKARDLRPEEGAAHSSVPVLAWTAADGGDHG